MKNEKNLKMDAQSKAYYFEIKMRKEELERNKISMVTMLTQWHILTEEIASGLLITPKEACQRALQTYNDLIELRMVDGDNLIVPAVREIYEDLVNAKL